jgi:benzodiazapine receptor
MPGMDSMGRDKSQPGAPPTPRIARRDRIGIESEMSVRRNLTPAADLVALAASIAIALLAGWIGSVATTASIPTWYAGLEKPSFTPPNAVFPVVWTILYVMMGVAAWRAWRSGGEPFLWRTALLAYAIQLILNVLWPLAFFGAESPLGGLIVIVVLLAAVVATILAFRRLDGIAALLLVPYLAWAMFATVLNASILGLNP